MPWEVLEHTADVGLVVTADSLEEAIEDLVEGFSNLVCPEGEVQPGEQRELTVTAVNLDDLIVDVLDDVNFLHQVEHFVPASADAQLSDEDGYEVELTVSGEDFDPNKHGHLMEIKATTYHGLEVHEEPAEIRVIFDV